MTLQKTIRHYFHGASAKWQPFRGWAGCVTDWPENAPPVIDFGKWIPDPSNQYGGGHVEFSAEPFALVMFGANSKEMRRKDKTTHFGFAGLEPDGNLRVSQLPPDSDAKAIFKAGGWQTPNQEKLIAELEKLESITSLDEIRNLLSDIKSKVLIGFGMQSLSTEGLFAWPELHPLCDALAVANKHYDQVKNAEKADKIEKIRLEAENAIEDLRSAGKELSAQSVAAQIVGGEDEREFKSRCKAKIKALNYRLGADWLASYL